VIIIGGRPVAINTFTPFSLTLRIASIADCGTLCVLNETNVPSISKKIALIFMFLLGVQGVKEVQGVQDECLDGLRSKD
jgi:hypothetical protein